MTPKRTKIGQKIHDEKLIKRVEEHQAKGFKVLADLPDMDKPKLIKGMIPDLVAIKHGKIQKIEEVETIATLKNDSDQQETFRQKAKELGIKYQTILAKMKRK